MLEYGTRLPRTRVYDTSANWRFGVAHGSPPAVPKALIPICAVWGGTISCGLGLRSTVALF